MKLRTSLIALILFVSGTGAGAQASSAPPSTDAALAPGDMVKIQVWREPDLSGEFIVNETGIVTLPLIGQFDVRALTVAELRDKLVSAYAAQLRNPSVTITPLRRIQVLGEVMKPGIYPADPTTTLSGLVALAGGATPLGDLRRIRLVRNGTVVRKKVDISSTVSMSNIRSSDQIFVDRRSWMDRNSAVVVSAGFSAATLLLSLILTKVLYTQGK